MFDGVREAFLVDAEKVFASFFGEGVEGGFVTGKSQSEFGEEVLGIPSDGFGKGGVFEIAGSEFAGGETEFFDGVSDIVGNFPKRGVRGIAGEELCFHANALEGLGDAIVEVASEASSFVFLRGDDLG